MFDLPNILNVAISFLRFLGNETTAVFSLLLKKANEKEFCILTLKWVHHAFKSTIYTYEKWTTKDRMLSP